MTPSPEQLRHALSMLYADPQALNAAVERAAGSGTPASQNPDVDPDFDRENRCGFPEVIFGERKSPSVVVDVLLQQHRRGQAGFVTRCNDEQAAAILDAFPDAIRNAVAGTVRLIPANPRQNSRQSRQVRVFVVTAGTTDRPVAEEAMETLRWMRIDCELIQDVGVAGPQRLLRHVPKLKTAAVIVCVAGMEAALPSVLGGHVGCPVIGVPTSVGYGASLQGITAMLSMLTCCAANVVTVNIDAGFKGGYVAGLIASRTFETESVEPNSTGASASRDAG